MKKMMRDHVQLRARCARKNTYTHIPRKNLARSYLWKKLCFLALHFYQSFAPSKIQKSGMETIIRASNWGKLTMISTPRRHCASSLHEKVTSNNSRLRSGQSKEPSKSVGTESLSQILQIPFNCQIFLTRWTSTKFFHKLSACYRQRRWKRLHNFMHVICVMFNLEFSTVEFIRIGQWMSIYMTTIVWNDIPWKAWK